MTADELDSYMYQTVGHNAIDLYAQAMDLPLYRGMIQGSSVSQGKVYTETQQDEVEDLYKLLKKIKVLCEFLLVCSNYSPCSLTMFLGSVLNIFKCT